MRVMIMVEFDTPTANGLITSDRMGSTIEAIMERLHPEAAYFYPRGGRRGVTLVVDAPDSAALPGLVEPFWLQLGAHVEAFPCMNADELREGLSRLA